MTKEEVMILDLSRSEFIEDGDVLDALEEFHTTMAGLIGNYGASKQVELAKRQLVDRLEHLSVMATIRAKRVYWDTEEDHVIAAREREYA